MTSATTYVPISYLLGILFIGLKLTNHIDWSWWWVLAPFWVAPAIVATIFVVLGIVAVVVALVER